MVYVWIKLPSLQCTHVAYRSDALWCKVKNIGHTRCWNEDDDCILACKYVSYFWWLLQLDLKCTGLHLLILMRKQILIGSVLVILHGIYEVPMLSSRSGNVSKPMMLIVQCAIMVSICCSFCLFFPSYISDRHGILHHKVDKTDLNWRCLCAIIS